MRRRRWPRQRFHKQLLKLIWVEKQLGNGLISALQFWEFPALMWAGVYHLFKMHTLSALPCLFFLQLLERRPQSGPLRRHCPGREPVKKKPRWNVCLSSLLAFFLSCGLRSGGAKKFGGVTDRMCSYCVRVCVCVFVFFFSFQMKMALEIVRCIHAHGRSCKHLFTWRWGWMGSECGPFSTGHSFWHLSSALFIPAVLSEVIKTCPLALDTSSPTVS